MLGIFADGEQLPNEITFAKQLSVSPVTLRDAIKTLRHEGLVRTSRGRGGGSFVIATAEGTAAQFEKSVEKMSALEVRDLLDWQTAVISHAAKLAASRASSSEIRTLEEAAGAAWWTDELGGVRRRYSRFLIGLASSSRSSRVSKAAIALQIEMAPLIMLALQRTTFRQELLETMGALVLSLRERDEAAAYRRMSDLMLTLGELVQRLHYDLTRHQTSTTAQNRVLPA